jgi:hypothetical protein
MKTTIKPIHLFAPIERVNDEERTITAYAFRNEVVDGEGGVRLRRTAMEAATDDYMQWANIRRMHQPDPVGVAQAVEWDDKGALMTLRVEDDDAWRKVKSGVYKGLSVGVLPRVMRGRDVTACKWFETSLVDRPKDTDCNFLVVRAEGVDPEAPVEVEVEEAPEERAENAPETEQPTEAPTEAPADEVVPEAVTEEPAAEEERADEQQRGVIVATPADWSDEVRGQVGAVLMRAVGTLSLPDATLPTDEELREQLARALTSSDVPSRENLDGPQSDTHYSCGAEGICHGHTTRGGAQECMERMAQGHEAHISALEEHLNTLKAKRRAELGEETPDLTDAATASPTDLLARVDGLPADQFPPFTTTILTRLEAAESGLAEERQLRTAAEERAETLAKQPAVVAPVRFPAALERTQTHLREQYPDLSKLDEEIKRAESAGIAARDQGDEAEALRCVDRLQRLKMQRAALVPAQS